MTNTYEPERLSTSQRRLSILSWLLTNNRPKYFDNLFIQKYLFFYELTSFSEGKDYSFDYMRGYLRGPVFSEVYGDAKYREQLFYRESDKASATRDLFLVDESIARFSSFMVSIFDNHDLSAFTHEFDVWKVKENQIQARTSPQIPLSEDDISQNDLSIIETLREVYNDSYIRSLEILEFSKENQLGNERKLIFLITKDDLARLEAENYEQVLNQLINEATMQNIENPVYITFDEEEGFRID
ncbi:MULTISPECIES: hypothetical protein [unclassified Exiguobacterium]|uniref:hypothetical protein n=1 Tax=unclassified Exiguobacterium TaxID=2644629 RepID=UPI001BEB111E|nr:MULTISPECIES: hypothetical protein [unclassified Exiguobacterium]